MAIVSDPSLKRTGCAYEVTAYAPGAGVVRSTQDLKKVLGYPKGAGPEQGSIDTVSLGEQAADQGILVVRLAAMKGGDRFSIAENGFGSKAKPESINPERATVSVREKNGAWVKLSGYAGINTVQANAAKGILPGDKKAGGDIFTVPRGMKNVSEVRIEDASYRLGNINPRGFGTDGPDIDAVCKLPKR